MQMNFPLQYLFSFVFLPQDILRNNLDLEYQNDSYSGLDSLKEILGKISISILDTLVELRYDCFLKALVLSLLGNKPH